MSQADPFTPPPVPIPAQPLGYSVVGRHGKPGIITAIGVMCIVVACLSGLSSLGTGFYAFAFWMMSKMSAAMSTATVTTGSSTMTVTSTSAGPVSTPNAPPPTLTLSPGEAGVAVNVLQSRLALGPAEVRELNKLVRTHGREVFGGDEDTPLSAAQVRSAIESFDRATDDEPARFTTDQGTVQVFRDHAVFTSADGSRTVQTSAKGATESTSGPPATLPTSTTVGQGPLTPAQINQVVAAVQQRTTVALNAAQVRSLRAELANPNQQLLTPGISPPVISVFVQPKGNARVQFNGGAMLLLASNGRVISSGPIMFPKFGVSGSSAGAVMGECGASLALAIYLLVCGIMAFRPSPRVPRLLRIYAFLKIPLALIAGASVGWMGYQFATAITSSTAATTGVPTAAPAVAAFIVWGSIIAAFGLAFPIALLITLHTRTVKGYYSLPAVG